MYLLDETEKEKHPRWLGTHTDEHRGRDGQPPSGLFSKASGGPYGTVLADPPWRFVNRTGKLAPEHRRLMRYDTMETK